MIKFHPDLAIREYDREAVLIDKMSVLIEQALQHEMKPVYHLTEVYNHPYLPAPRLIKPEPIIGYYFNGENGKMNLRYKGDKCIERQIFTKNVIGEFVQLTENDTMLRRGTK